MNFEDKFRDEFWEVFDDEFEQPSFDFRDGKEVIGPSYSKHHELGRLRTLESIICDLHPPQISLV
jgi:hypothetical protein